MRATWPRLPVRFERNLGQFDERARYVARTGGTTLALTDEGGMLAVPAVDAVLTLRVAGGRPGPPQAGAPLATRTNYFAGSAPAEWHTNVPNFGSVSYPSVIDGVDLVYHGDAAVIEYDFVVAPGADPQAIALEVGGAESLALGDDGRLVVATPHGTLAWPAPVLYQDSRGAGPREPVRGKYRLGARRAVGFEVASYDRSRPLVIDPALAYATYLDGASVTAIAVDAAGSAYVTGNTASAFSGVTSAFPLSGPASGGFVAKLDPSGSALEYVTYFASGEGDAIAVDATGAAYVTGGASTGFPTKNAIQPASVQSQNSSAADTDAFVAKLAPSGADLVYSTFLGGLFTDQGKAIAVDASGNAYVTGQTQSSDMPIGTPLLPYSGPYNGSVENAFVVEIAASGSSVVYGAYLGGTYSPPNQVFGAGGWTSGNGIAVDGAGNAYVVGTTAPGFPLVNALYGSAASQGGQAFLTEFAADGGAVVYSTFLGGSAGATGTAVAVDPAGNAYATGTTGSSDFASAGAAQATYAGQNDAFVIEIAPSGASRVYATYLGGSSWEDGWSIAVDPSGNAYVTGETASADFPTRSALQASLNVPSSLGGDAPSDAFVAMVASSGGSLVYSTYLGGSGRDTGQGIAVDDAGTAYVTGPTWSPDFPTRRALYGAPDGGAASFVATIVLGTDGGVDDATDAAADQLGEASSPTADASATRRYRGCRRARPHGTVVGRCSAVGRLGSGGREHHHAGRRLRVLDSRDRPGLVAGNVCPGDDAQRDASPSPSSARVVRRATVAGA